MQRFRVGSIRAGPMCAVWWGVSVGGLAGFHAEQGWSPRQRGLGGTVRLNCLGEGTESWRDRALSALAVSNGYISTPVVTRLRVFVEQPKLRSRCYCSKKSANPESLQWCFGIPRVVWMLPPLQQAPELGGKRKEKNCYWKPHCILKPVPTCRLCGVFLVLCLFVCLF